MNQREQDIDRRVCDRYLTVHGDQWAHAHDAQYHLDITRVRQLLVATENALTAEGIAAEVRDRVIFRLLYGEPPDGYVGPDWREAANRAVQQDLETARLAQAAPIIGADVLKDLGLTDGR